MIREELKQLPTTARDLRKFGLVVGAVFLLLGGWFLYRDKPIWPWLGTPGVLLAGFGLVCPAALRHVYLGWMAMALTLGIIVSTVILTLFYYLVLTPIGIIGRLAGQDFLSRKLDRAARSYWIERVPSAAKGDNDYERQY